ncbi:MAG: MFS transporter [Candidatus Rokubacteria bacterium]|nr:MFS transporter [Candidatus Rokubacteria bacterium]
MTASWRILVLILAVQTVANIGPMGLPAIAPLIREDLDLSLTQAGSFLSAYYVGPILMSLPAGWLADRWGIRRTMVAGQALIALGLLSAALARSFAVLVPLTILAGVGYGMLNPTSTKAVIAWFPQRQRATAVGLKQTGLPFGGVLGAALLPALGLAIGWRAAVMASAASILVLGAATLILYRDPPDLLRPSGGGGSGMIRTVLGTADLWWVSLATLIFAVLQTVWLSFLVLYLHEVVRLSVVSAAGYLAQAQVTGILGRIGFGVLSDRLFGGRRRIVLFLAGSGSMLCSIAIAATGPGTPAWQLSLLALSFGFVGIGWNGVQHTLLAELAGPRAAGTAVGLGLAVSSLGVTLGPPVFGWAVERIGGYGAAWIGLAATMAGALVLLGRVRESRRLYDR